MISNQSHYIEAEAGRKLHVKKVYSTERSIGTILFIHGAIENGRVFYSDSGKGLAYFLAKSGFTCYVADLRARGLSSPGLEVEQDFNQFDILENDFPLLIKFVQRDSGLDKLSILTHSWGGVLANCFLLKSPLWIEKINSLVHIASKRRVSVFNIHRLFYIDLMWNLIGNLILLFKGYLPKDYYGPDGESRGTLKDSQKWVYSKSWTDSENGLDYAFLATQHKLPPSLYLTGSKDHCLGHIADVRNFANECGFEDKDVELIGKAQGHSEDYDHISILTSPNAEMDHFPLIESFLRLQSKS